MSSVRIGVVADARRGEMGADLAERVDATWLNVDSTMQGCTWNHTTMWRKIAEEAGDWNVVLEDDALPVPGFREQLDDALAIAPAPIVSLYLGRGYISDTRTEQLLLRADQLDAHWVVTQGGIYHAVALAVHKDLIPDLTSNLPSGSQPIDRSLSMWARRQGHRVAYCWPSLVDHADKPSLVTRYNRAERRAWRAGERDAWHDKMIAMI